MKICPNMENIWRWLCKYNFIFIHKNVPNVFSFLFDGVECGLVWYLRWKKPDLTAYVTDSSKHILISCIYTEVPRNDFMGCVNLFSMKNSFMRDIVQRICLIHFMAEYETEVYYHNDYNAWRMFQLNFGPNKSAEIRL